MSHPRQNAHPRQNERVAYHNGQILPESEVLISFRDRGFLFGDAVFDTARTFAHKPFRLKEHVDRLFHSLDYLRIDPGLTPAETVAISEEVLERNLHLIDKEDDYWLTQRISRGPLSLDRDTAAVGKPTVIVECQPLPLKARAKNFRDGIEVVVPPTRRTPPDSFSPRAKSHNYLNMIIGDHEARALNPNAWAVLLDHERQSRRGHGLQYLPGARGQAADAAGALRPAGDQPGDGDGAGEEARHSHGRAGYRSL